MPGVFRRFMSAEQLQRTRRELAEPQRLSIMRRWELMAASAVLNVGPVGEDYLEVTVDFNAVNLTVTPATAWDQRATLSVGRWTR